MLDNFNSLLNNVITNSYSLLSQLEQVTMKKSKRFNLSINEIHLIEAVNKKPIDGITITDLASQLFIAPSSVTVAVNKLEKKGYVVKSKNEVDGRQVYVKLTDEGRHIDRIHKRFHKNLTNNITKSLNEDEKRILLNSLNSINEYLKLRVNLFNNQI